MNINYRTYYRGISLLASFPGFPLAFIRRDKSKGEAWERGYGKQGGSLGTRLWKARGKPGNEAMESKGEAWERGYGKQGGSLGTRLWKARGKPGNEAMESKGEAWERGYFFTFEINKCVVVQLKVMTGI